MSIIVDEYVRFHVDGELIAGENSAISAFFVF